MAFRLGVNESIIACPQAIKSEFRGITKGMETEVFFGDDNWRGSQSKQFVCKISKGNFEIAFKTIPSVTSDYESKTGGRRIINFILGNYKIQFQESSKRSGAPDGGTTQQQELASLWMIEQALGSANRIYKDITDLKGDKAGFAELVKLYPDLETNTKWINGLIAQQKTVGDRLKKGHYTVFNRDGGFMDFIAKIVKDKFGITKKDSWNPADVWVIKDQKKVEKQIKEAVDGRYSSIQELNAVMRLQWEDKQLKGISLKAISGKDAKWEEVNITKALFTETNKPPVFELKEAMIKLDLKPTKVFQSQDTIIRIKEGNVEYKFQIKMNSRGFSNLKFEPTQKGSGAARLGKVPLDMLKSMLSSDYNLSFKNNNSLHPKTRLEFEQKEKHYSNMWTNVKKGGAVTNIHSAEDFRENMKTVFTLEPDVANSKLMQLDFLNLIFSLNEKKRDKLLTDMVFLAMKKGEMFGPFAKLF
jgi:hypothetical protein|tara:strand:- start:656 stop:2071 length:1416 start_codon:yes stop_codon:yes gene_type:complete